MKKVIKLVVLVIVVIFVIMAVKDSARKVVDTGVTYKFSPVSDTVAEFEVYNFDSEKHTFDSVYITYNLNYFDDPN